MTNNNQQNLTPIQRLREFVIWAVNEGVCKSERDFERKCGLSSNYILNNASNGKGNIGTEMLGRIVKVFPRLNLAWICTGEGNMIQSEQSANLDYKQAYEGAMSIVDALNKIINKRE